MVFLGCMPSSGTAESYYSFILVFWGTSKVVVSIYILTNSARGFPFLHTLSSIYCFDGFWWLPFSPAWGPFVVIWMIQIEVSQKEKKQVPHINTCVWTLEERYWCTYLQGRNREADVEDILVETVGEGESGTNWEGSVTFVMSVTPWLPCIKEIAGGKLLCCTRSSACRSVII